MAIPHLASGQVASVLPLGPLLADAKTTALFKGPHLEVMRMILPAGKKIAPHHVNGPITIHCLEGEVDVGVENERQILRSGDLLYLAGNVKHDLIALTNTALLVSVVLLTTAA
ncbi:MAG: cupin domain-containing protein [Pseudomonadota bacterium]